MNKLFGLFLLALAFIVPPTAANAACSGGACFWIGGTGTVDGTLDNGKWATTSGGASCACVPSTTDSVTFDGSSGTGTVTINMGGALWTTGAFTMTLASGLTIDFATNSNSWASASGSFAAGGASTKTLNMGSGTFSLQSAACGTNWDTSGSGLTLNAGTSTISIAACTTATVARRFFGGGKTYATISVLGGTNSHLHFANAGFTAATLTIAAPNTITFANSNTFTITTFTNTTGTSSTPVFITNDGPLNGRATISSANNWTCTWCSIQYTAFSGGGTFTANSSFGANNTGITVNAPPAGGATPRTIGG